jgi:stearoyl-CoA desaturase (delta-9 desaturase)
LISLSIRLHLKPVGVIMKNSSKPYEQWTWWEKVDWTNALFLIITPVIAVTWLPIHTYIHGLSTSVLIFFFIYSIITSMSITGGYHRLFAHKSYDANPVVKFLYLVFASGAFQGSALKWCTDHRRHHKHVDTEVDPYSIKKGFFYAHIGWVFLKENPKYKLTVEHDLAKDPLVIWQNKYNVPLSVFIGFGVPTLIGWWLGSPIAGLLYAGVLRVVVTQHFTFFINSFCHMLGRQPFSEANTARDSWVLALFTYGEGYHNYHHKFQGDYRNGIRWYDWDPTKWSIGLMSFLGLAQGLKRIPAGEILKAKLSIQEKSLIQRGAPIERIELLRSRIQEAQTRFRKLKEEYQLMKKTWANSSQEQMLRLKTDIKLAKIEFKSNYRQWRTYYRAWKKRPALVVGG